MAMIDYGAIAFKNGKCIQTDMSTPMIDMVGWEDTEEDNTRQWNRGIENLEKLNLTGNYFSYIGDEYLTVGSTPTDTIPICLNSKGGRGGRRTPAPIVPNPNTPLPAKPTCDTMEIRYDSK